MAVAQIGAGGATLVKTGREFDPQQGFIYVSTYEGNEASIRGLESVFTAAKARTRVEHDGPVYSIEVRNAAPSSADGAEQPLDKWNLDIDFAQESIWSAPHVLSAAAAADETGTFTADDMIAYWKSAIKAKQEETIVAPAATGFAEPLRQIYANIIRGQEAYEVERPTLSRVRTYSASYATRIRIEAIPTVYTTTALILSFAVPALIVAQLPDNPAYTPPYTAWSWKKRKQSSETVVALNKIQETTEWVFAAWDTLTYNVV